VSESFAELLTNDALDCVFAVCHSRVVSVVVADGALLFLPWWFTSSVRACVRVFKDSLETVVVLLF